MSTNIINSATPQLVVQNYFNLVEAIARKIKRRLPAHVDVQDLVQTGMIGLLEASSRYDDSRAVQFATYANSRITGAILDELRRSDTCSRQDRKSAREIEGVKTCLRAQHGADPSRTEIAEAVGLGLEEYDRALQRLESSKLPSIPNHDDGSMEVDAIGNLASHGDSPFEACSKREDFGLLGSYIERLKPRQRQILRLYYFEGLRLKEIGARLGVGEARISQIHKQAVTELRRMMDSGQRTPAAKVSTLVN